MSKGQAKKSRKPHIVWFTLSAANFRMVGFFPLQGQASSCLPQQLNFLSNHLTRLKKTATEFTSIAQTQRNTRRIANKFVTVAGSIWGSCQGWGSFRGRDHFGGCTCLTLFLGHLSYLQMLKIKDSHIRVIFL